MQRYWTALLLGLLATAASLSASEGGVGAERQVERSPLITALDKERNPGSTNKR